MLEIRLLGQFAVHLDGRAIELPSRASQALLAYLVLNAPRKQPRERLAGILWPDADDESARQGLRNALWRLRSAVGEHHFAADKLTIGLADASAWWSDVSGLLESDDADATTQELAHTLEGYAGELLPGFYDEWVALERERLAAAFERKVAALVARLESEKNWPETLAWCERWLALAGASEPAYRALMRAQAALGDRAGIGAAYRRCVAALDEDLGMPPSEATMTLYQRLSQESAPMAPPMAPSEPAQRPAFLSEDASQPFRRLQPAGLDSELQTLLSAVDQALSGQGRLMLVAGEAGEGKSTLLDAFTDLALERHPDLVIARGTSDAFVGGGRAFGPFSDAFRMLTGDVEAGWAAGRLSTAQARRLWALMPLVVGAILGRGRPLLGTLIDGPTLAGHAAAYATAGALPGLPELLTQVEKEASTAGRLEQGVLFEACADFLLTLAQARPMVLLIDDMHWMDAASADLLLHLSRRLAGTRLLIIGAYRLEETSPTGGTGVPLASLLGELQRTAGKMTLTLGTRDEAAAIAFVDQLLDREPHALSEAFRLAIARRTGGHPLFTVELLNDMKERGWLVPDADGRWTAPGDIPDELPARVEGVLQSRFGRLDDDLHQALSIAAVEGEEFTAEVVARVANVDPWRLLDRLASDAGRRHRLVDELGPMRVGGRRLSRFRFRHNLFQRFLYDGLGPSLRPHRHEAVAEMLAELYGPDAETIAVSLGRHYLAAELPERALPYLLSAGRSANRLSAHRAALEHLEAALQALESVPPGPDRDVIELDVHLELAVALHVTAGFAAPSTGAHAGRAVALAEAAGDTDRHFRALWNLWLHHAARLDSQASMTVADALLKAAGEDPVRKLQAHHAAWSACFHGGDLSGSRQHLEAGAPLYDESCHGEVIAAYGGHDPGVCRLIYEARVGLQDGAYRRAHGCVEDALALAHRLGHAYGVSQALAVAVEVSFWAGDFAGAVRAADEAITYADDHGLPFWGAFARLNRGWAEAWLGRSEGLAAIRRFMEAHAPEPGGGAPMLRMIEASACLALGRIEEGIAAGSAGIAAGVKTGDTSCEAELYRLLAELELSKSAPDREMAERHLERAVAIAEAQGSPALTYRATATLAALWASGPRETEGELRLAGARERLAEAPPEVLMNHRRPTSGVSPAEG